MVAPTKQYRQLGKQQMSLPRTVVEFVDTNIDPAIAHVVKEVRINGTPVLIEKDGVNIEYGTDKATVVTLRILATEIRFNHAEGDNK